MSCAASELAVACFLVNDPCSLASFSLQSVTICSLMSKHSDKVQIIPKTSHFLFDSRGHPDSGIFLMEQPLDSSPLSCCQSDKRTGTFLPAFVVARRNVRLHPGFIVPHITGAGVPSDHLPVATMNTSMGSGAPRNCGSRATGVSDLSAPQVELSMSGV